MLFLASVMLAFADRSVVKKVVNFLPRVGVGGRYGLPQQRYDTYSLIIKCESSFFLSDEHH